MTACSTLSDVEPRASLAAGSSQLVVKAPPLLSAGMPSVVALPSAEMPKRPRLTAARTPWIRQKTPSDCGRAVLASIVARNGGDIEEIYRKIPDPEDPVSGYSVAEMRKYAATEGVVLEPKFAPGVSAAGSCERRPAVAKHLVELRLAASAGRAVIVPTSKGLFNGHYLVLLAGQGDHFILLDPSSPDELDLTAAELEQAMCGFGYIAYVSKEPVRIARPARQEQSAISERPRAH